jgi:FkbM family methyltransferase
MAWWDLDSDLNDRIDRMEGGQAALTTMQCHPAKLVAGAAAPSIFGAMEHTHGASAGEGLGRQADLVFDLGFHRGEDSGYYLAMGRRVVAVEANRELVAAGRERFAAEHAAGRFTLVHAAVVGAAQRQKQAELLFYPHPERSEWGSVDGRWVSRNAEAHGLPHGPPVTVPALSLEELIAHYGCPDFLKIDIEGADEAVLADLSLLAQRPTYVSWETGKESLRAVFRQHRRLARLGYGRFRVVQQAYLECAAQVPCPDGCLWSFEPGCSGPLPELCGGPWRPLGWVLLNYGLLFCAYRMVGPRSWFRELARRPSPWIGGLPRRLIAWADGQHIPLPGWFDSHAMWTGARS